MTDGGGWLRRAGRGRTDDGAVAIWTISDGSRGRRWREAVVDIDGGIRSSLLFETDRDRCFSHMELSTAAGLLTLHPETDGTLHGNVVSRDGIRHVVGLPWQRTGIVGIEGSPLALAAALFLLERQVGEGSALEVASIEIGLDLIVTAGRSRVERMTADGWRLGGRAVDRTRAGGLPALRDAVDWPLELEPVGQGRGLP
ncbi:MAG: hypothetical protein ACJ77N_09970 [Chloroflexota bacterium]